MEVYLFSSSKERLQKHRYTECPLSDTGSNRRKQLSRCLPTLSREVRKYTLFQFCVPLFLRDGKIYTKRDLPSSEHSLFILRWHYSPTRTFASLKNPQNISETCKMYVDIVRYYDSKRAFNFFVSYSRIHLDVMDLAFYTEQT